MNVLIKGMKMPETCNECYLRDENICPILRCVVEGYYRPSFCPIVEVPTPHGRLGDLDKLEKMFVDIDNAPYSGFDGTEPFYSAEDAALIIRLTPIIIEAEEEQEY